MAATTFTLKLPGSQSRRKPCAHKIKTVWTTQWEKEVLGTQRSYVGSCAHRALGNIHSGLSFQGERCITCFLPRRLGLEVATSLGGQCTICRTWTQQASQAELETFNTPGDLCTITMRRGSSKLPQPGLKAANNPDDLCPIYTT